MDDWTMTMVKHNDNRFYPFSCPSADTLSFCSIETQQRYFVFLHKRWFNKPQKYMSQLKLKSIFVVSIKSCILDRQNDLEKIRKSREYKQTRKQSVLKMHIAIVIAEEIQGLQRIALKFCKFWASEFSLTLERSFSEIWETSCLQSKKIQKLKTFRSSQSLDLFCNGDGNEHL